jgi:hypothetical protein
MTWLKYADSPIDRASLVDCDQRTELRSKYEKPRGCWITDDSEDCWKTLCLGESFLLDRLTHKHEVVLDESRLLILRSALEVRLFTENFAEEHDRGGYNDLCINWHRVATIYDGLIITPYQWSLRLADRFSWYYGWDCASGCIWRTRSILDVKLIEVDHTIGKTLLEAPCTS